MTLLFSKELFESPRGGLGFKLAKDPDSGSGSRPAAGF
jgi:hypothetical protein